MFPYIHRFALKKNFLKSHEYFVFYFKILIIYLFLKFAGKGFCHGLIKIYNLFSKNGITEMERWYRYIYRVMMSKERVIVPEIGNLSVNRFHISSVFGFTRLTGFNLCLEETNDDVIRKGCYYVPEFFKWC